MDSFYEDNCDIQDLREHTVLQHLYQYIVYTDNESCTIGGGSDFKKEIPKIITRELE